MFKEALSAEMRERIDTLKTYYDERERVEGSTSLLKNRFGAFRELISTVERAEKLLILQMIQGAELTDELVVETCNVARAGIATLAVETLAYLDQISPNPDEMLNAYAEFISSETRSLREALSQLQPGDHEKMGEILTARKESYLAETADRDDTGNASTGMYL